MGILRITLGSIAVLTLMGCSTMRVRSDFSERASFTHLRTYAWVEETTEYTAKEAADSPLLGQHIRYAVDAELLRRGYRLLESGRPDFLIAYRIITRRKIGASDAYGYGNHAVPATSGDGRLSLTQGYSAYGSHVSHGSKLEHAGYRSRGSTGHLRYRSYGHYGYGRHGHHRGHFGFGRHGYRYGGYGHPRHLYFGLGYYGHGYGGYGYGRYVDDYLEGTLVLDIIDPAANEVIWRGWASQALDSDPDPERFRMYVNDAVKEILAEFPPTA
ncbi:MAG: DUF4136 domain-containing protein [Candidatus Krumholzibacteria bacterium]